MISLSKLPAEVLRQICSELDKKDAVNLCTASSTLRPFAEERVWRDININDTLAPYLELTQPYTSANPVGATTGIAASNKPLHDVQHSPACQLHQLLQAYPSRQVYIKHLAFQFRFDTPTGLEELSLLIGPTLQSLEWRTSGPAFYASASILAGLRVFERLDGKLGRLKKLYMTIRTDWTRTMIAITKAAPNLEVMQVNSHPRLIRNVSPDCTDTPPASKMPRLRTLIVGNMEKSFAPFLASLIGGSETIQEVTLDDYSFTWRPEQGDQLVHALAISRSLKTLKVTCVLTPYLQHVEGWEGLESLSLQWGADSLSKDTQQDFAPPYMTDLKVYSMSFSTFTTAGELDLTSDAKAMRTSSVKALRSLKYLFEERQSLERIELQPGIDRGYIGEEVVMLSRP